jgi:hypothetical protein
MSLTLEFAIAEIILIGVLAWISHELIGKNPEKAKRIVRYGWYAPLYQSTLLLVIWVMGKSMPALKSGDIRVFIDTLFTEAFVGFWVAHIVIVSILRSDLRRLSH